MSFQKHSFHLVDPSPWPFFGSIAALTTTVGAVMFFNAYTGGNYLLFLGIIMILFIMYVWWRDIVREGLYEGHHSLTVQLGLRYGMILFIISKIDKSNSLWNRKTSSFSNWNVFSQFPSTGTL